MSRQGKAGVQVNKKAGYTEISFWGSKNGVPTRLYSERLVNPAPDVLASLCEITINELRARQGK